MTVPESSREAAAFRTVAARRLFLDVELCRNERLRLKAIKSLVSGLPRSKKDICKLLLTSPHRYSPEVHFSVFCCLDSSLPPGLLRQLLPAVEEYLKNVQTQAAYAAWMAGDMLAHWADSDGVPEAVNVLARSATGARYVAGHRGALHGIEHVLDFCPVSQGKELLDMVAQLMREDRSRELRDYARRMLDSGGCWSKEDPVLRRYAGRLLDRHG